MNDTNEPALDPVLMNKNIFVTGSDDFTYTNILAQALVEWWLNEGRPYTTLHIEDTQLGATVSEVWGKDKFPFITHPAKMESRRQERDRRERILTSGMNYAFVFEVNDDCKSWIDDFNSRNIPWTRVTITRST